MTILVGVGNCLLGIVFAVWQEYPKKRRFREAEARLHQEFNLRRVYWCYVSGVMSACFAYGLAAAIQSKDHHSSRHTRAVARAPRLVVVLLGGFTTNFVWW